MLIRNQRAFVSGALFVAVAAFFFIVALNYQPGTAARMGPGFFPRMMSIILAAIGLFVMAGAVMPKAKIEHLERWDRVGRAVCRPALSARLRAVAFYPHHRGEPRQPGVHLARRAR